MKMSNIVTKSNLQQGLSFWQTKKSWPPDLHNDFYQRLYLLKQEGLNDKWWRAIVDHLWRWRAIRPKNKNYVLERGKERLGQLQAEYEQIQKICTNFTSSLSELSWEDMAHLYQVSYSIKNVNSPVFGSKLCHFIIPELFPVIDRDAIGIGDQPYSNYWKFCKEQWLSSTAQSELVEMIKQTIGPNIIDHYPYAVKITELCIIGNRIRC